MKECAMCQGTGIGFSGVDMDGSHAEYDCTACGGTGEKRESLKRPEDMTLAEANAEYDRLYAFAFPSTADFQRMSRCSRRINELKQEGN